MEVPLSLDMMHHPGLLKQVLTTWGEEKETKRQRLEEHRAARKKNSYCIARVGLLMLDFLNFVNLGKVFLSM